jgi:hypothetical protein
MTMASNVTDSTFHFVQNPQLDSLYRLWESKLTGRLMPARRDFLAEDFAPWMPNLAISDVEAGPRRYRLRLVGTGINEYDGADYTGRYLDEVLAPSVKVTILAQFDRCADGGVPMPVRYRGEFQGSPVAIDKLFLPLSSDGRTVDKLLVCIYAKYDWAKYAWREGPTLQALETPPPSVKPSLKKNSVRALGLLSRICVFGKSGFSGRAPASR